jgi:hypothetical protein
VRLLVPRTDPQVPVNPARGLISILTARSLPPFPRTLISRRSRSSSTCYAPLKMSMTATFAVAT